MMIEKIVKKKLQTPEEVKTPEIFEHVVFEQKRDRNGALAKIRNSAPGRKEIVLSESSYGLLDELEGSYTVRVIEDTKPDDPSKGSYVVEIVPVAEDTTLKARAPKWQNLEDLKSARKVLEGLKKNPDNYEKALTLAKSLKLSGGTLQSPDIQEAALNSFRRALVREDILGALQIRQVLQLPPERVLPLVQHEAIDRVLRNSMGSYNLLKKSFGLPDDFLTSGTTQEAVMEVITKDLAAGNLGRAVAASKSFKIPEATIRQLAVEHTMESIKKGDLNKALNIKESFRLSHDLFQGSEAREGLIDEIVHLLNRMDSNGAMRLIEAFKPQDYTSSSRVRKAALHALENHFRHGWYSYAEEIQKNFALPDEETHRVIKEELLKRLSDGDIDSILRLAHAFQLPKEMFASAEVYTGILTCIEKSLSVGRTNSAFKMLELLEPLESVPQTPSIQQKVKSCFTLALELNEWSTVRRVQRVFGISMEDANELYQKEILKLCEEGYVGMALGIKEGFALPNTLFASEKITGLIVRHITKCLDENSYQYALRIKSGFGISIDAASSGPIRSAAATLMERHVRADSLHEALEIKKEFGVPDDIAGTIALKTILVRLGRGEFGAARRIKESFGLTKISENTEAAASARKVLQDTLRDNDSVKDLMALEIFSAQVLHAEAYEAMLWRLKVGMDGDRIIELGILTSSDVLSKELVEAAQQGVLTKLGRGDPHITHLLKFNIPEEFFKEEKTLALAERALQRRLKIGQWSLDELKAFSIRREVLTSPETKAALRKGLVLRLMELPAEKVLREWLPPIAQEIYQGSMPEGELQHVLKEALAQRIWYGKEFNDLSEFLPKDVISSVEIQEAIKGKLITRLEAGLVVREDFLNLASKEVLHSAEMQRAAENGLMTALTRQGEEKNRRENEEDGADASVQYIMEKYPLPQDARRITELTREIFGSTFSREQFALVRAGERGEKLPPEFLQSLAGTGLENVSPEKILPTLKEKIAHFRKTLLDDTPDTKLLKTPFFRDMFRALVRADVVKWSRAYSFNDMLEAYIDRTEKGERYPLSDGYAESGSVRIKKIERDAPQFTEAFSNKYATLRGDLARALGLLQYQEKPFSALAKQVKSLRSDMMPELEQKRGPGSDEIITMRDGEQKIIQNAKAREHLEKTIDALLAINPRSVKDFEKNFALLAQHKEFEGILRTTVFLKSLHKHRALRDEARSVAERDTPTFDDITWMTNYMMQVTHHDTWKDYFTDKQALKAFKGITNTNALSEELARFEQRIQNATIPVEFVPTRGLLFEFSGELADSCWMAKEKNAAKLHPNFTSVTMVANRNTPNERLVGACILIESKAKNGDDLIIIRGLNPVENFINQLSVADFVGAFTNYVKAIARTRSRKAAIIIDDSRGMAATNRQVVFDYINDMKGKLHKAPLASEKETTYNRYNVVNDTYYLP